MNPDVRETLGKAAYEAVTPLMEEDDIPHIPWSSVSSMTRESYRIEAEAVVRKLAEQIAIPVLNILLSEDDIKRLLEQMV